MTAPYEFRWCGACMRYHRATAPADKLCKELDAFSGEELTKRYGARDWRDDIMKHIPFNPPPKKRGRPRKG